MPADPAFLGTWSTVVVNGQTFQVSDEGYRGERYKRRGVDSFSTKVWLCKWSDRGALQNALLGGSTNVMGGVVFTNGWPHPEIVNFYVQTVDVEPVGLLSTNTFAQPTYEYARLVIQFGPPSWDLTQLSAIGELHCHMASQSIPLDQNQTTFEYTADSVAIGPAQRSFVEFSIMEISLTLYERVGFNGPLINSLMDCTNNAAFYGAAVESVRFRGAETDRRAVTTSYIQYDTTIYLAWHPISGGWNKLPRAGSSPLWQPYRVKATGLKEFPPADITQLLRM